MEANTVANLMRRRERPKSIVPKLIDCASSLERRSFSQGPPMPVRPGIVLEKCAHVARHRQAASARPARTQIALVRFHVLGTGDARHSMSVLPRRSQGLFLLPKSAAGRPARFRSDGGARAPDFATGARAAFCCASPAAPVFVCRGLQVRQVGPGPLHQYASCRLQELGGPSPWPGHRRCARVQRAVEHAADGPPRGGAAICILPALERLAAGPQADLGIEYGRPCDTAWAGHGPHGAGTN